MNVNVEQYHVSQLDGMHRHDTALAEVTFPVLIGVLVVDSILDIIR